MLDDTQSSVHQGTLSLYLRVIVRPYFWQIVPILLLMLVGSALEVVTVGLAVPLLDTVTRADNAEAGRVVHLTTRAMASLGLSTDPNVMSFTLLVMAATLFAVRSAFSLVNQYSMAALAQKLRRRMKNALFEHFLCAKFADIAKRDRGAVYYDLNKPAESLHGSALQLGILITTSFDAVMLLGLMLYLSWSATLVVGFFGFASVQLFRKLLDRRANECGRDIYELNRVRNKVEVDAVDGVKVVKMHGLEGRMLERQEVLLRAEVRPTLKLVLFEHGPFLANEVLAAIVVLGLAIVTFLIPSAGMRFATMVAFLLAIRRVASALSRMNAAMVNLSILRRGIEVIDEFLNQLAVEPSGGRVIKEKIKEIRLVNVCFAYSMRPTDWVVRDVDLTMKQGTVTAVVGLTGAGKSTIGNLVAGLYSSQSGKILVNGVELAEINLKSWRRRIGYVSQDIFLFNASIRDNMILDADHISQEELEKIVRIVQLQEFIEALPEGYDTVVGDRGLRLSGGQCQRVAIARAILRRPDVLIFDEATSALDNLTESAVYRAIDALRQGSIVLIIAHRLSTIRNAEQIAVLADGKVFEVGTHESLMKAGGTYAKLYQEDGRLGVDASPDGESRALGA